MDNSAEFVELLFGASDRWMTAWASASLASGSPTISRVCAAATAICNDDGSAMPMSSLARIIRRRATNRGSSPAASIRAR